MPSLSLMLAAAIATQASAMAPTADSYVGR